MGLFDFLKSKPKNTVSSLQRESEQNKNENSLAEDTILYKTKMYGKEITNQSELIKKVVDKMVEEDPFQNFYGGKTEEDLTIPSQKVYEYAEISTMNVGLLAEGDSTWKLLIEGIELGTIPSEIAAELKPYYGNNMLTAYAFITGGRFKEHSAETSTVEEGFVPYDLDIFLQYN